VTGKSGKEARKTHDGRTFGFLAIVASMVLALVGRSLFRGWAMIHTVVSTHINAPPERVAALYAEYERLATGLPRHDPRRAAPRG
jgi:hypothetical protein